MIPPTPRIRPFRHQLANVDSLPQLAVMGVLTGLITTMVIALFQQFIAVMTGLLTNEAEGLAFESLSWPVRLLLPFAGALLVMAIGLISCNYRRYQRVGVVHVIERLEQHNGRLRPGNFLYQFFAGAVVIATGHSIGREGPAVHLGAAAASIMGKCLRLPNNSLRILVASGAAAAISATFNTPVAGVMFAMEVLRIEYTVGGFLPVLLASATAAVIIQSVYGYAPAFVVPPITIDAIHELPMVIAIGIAAGLLGALYCRLIVITNRRTRHLSPYIKLLMAAIVTGLLAIPSPAIMGEGYDTMTILAQGTKPLSFLIVLLVCKMVATTFSIGLGVPGGLIGPALMTGAIIGALVADISLLVPDFATHSTGFLVTVGMSAVLGAVLQAPLTALMTVLELTRNPELPFPALVAIAIATLIASLIMQRKGIFEQLLDACGRH